jgi:hypothetical protein
MIEANFTLLTSITVAGIAHGDMKGRLGELEDGPVELRRDPNNPADPNAIKVVVTTKEGPKRLGYVPAIFCPILINLRAAGYEIKSTITTRNLPHTVGLHMYIERKAAQ